MFKKLEVSKLDKASREVFVKATWTNDSINGLVFHPEANVSEVYIEVDEIEDKKQPSTEPKPKAATEPTEQELEELTKPAAKTPKVPKKKRK